MVHHTQNNNHLNQNIGSIRHKLSLLVKDNAAECNISQKKRNYHEAIHDGAIAIKGTI